MLLTITGLILGTLVLGILVLAGRLLYLKVRFTEYVRRLHPDTYHRLMHGWDGPAFMLTGHELTSGDLNRFMWKSEDDLGDATVALLRRRIRQTLRHLVLLAGAMIVLAFPLIAATHIWPN